MVHSVGQLAPDGKRERKEIDRTPRFRALHKKSWAVIDRPYKLGSATVGALYERPRSVFCAKPLRGQQHKFQICPLRIPEHMSLLKVLRDPKQFSLHVEMCPPRVDLPLEQI